jgi:ribosomal protein S17E
MYRKEYFSAFRTGIKLVDDLSKVDTSQIKNEITIYYDFLVAAQNYFLGYSQSHYSILRPFIVGDPEILIENGLRSLKLIFKSNNKFLQTEACYLLMKIYSEIRAEYNIGSKYASWLTTEYPENIIFQIEYLKCISKNTKNSTFADDYRKQMLNDLSNKNINHFEKEHIKHVINDL